MTYQSSHDLIVVGQSVMIELSSAQTSPTQ